MIIFKNKFLFKLIASVCVFLALSNFVLANRVFAEDDEVWGGPLVKPIMNLFVGISDGIMDILHNAVLKQDTTLIKIDTSNNKATIWGWIVGVVAAALTVALLVGTGPAGAALGATLATKITGVWFAIKAAATVTTAGVISGVLVGVLINGASMSENLYLPVFNLTSEEIFKNEIPLFDVNFFDPMEDKEGENKGEGIIYKETVDKDNGYDECGWLELADELAGVGEMMPYPTTDVYDPAWEEDIYNSTKCVFNIIKEKLGVDLSQEGYSLSNTKCSATENDGYVNFNIQTMDEETSWVVVCDIVFSYVKDNKASLIIRQDPYAREDKPVTLESTARRISGVISTWYFILRNLALLVLMIVLIYTGIRIVLGSTAGEKAKYKERLMDWLVALCLVFIMHYIMVFAIEITEKITDLVDSTGKKMINRSIILTDKQKEVLNQNKDGIKDELKDYIIFENDQNGQPDMSKPDMIAWGTDLTGGMRVDLQLVNEGTANWLGYGICYIILVMYTLFFSWTYMKRVLYMAFLTIIAPLVAMTYPIDKITDGKAQAFNQWLKEYIFNLLIQPFHLLLYTILVSAAFQLAAENPLYAIVAIGFMMPAEKLLRKFFGFDKAQTPGLLGGAAGAALAWTGLQKFMGHGPRDRGGSSKEKGEHKDSNKVKFSSSEATSPKAAIASEYADTEGAITQQDVPEEGQPIRQSDNVPFGETPQGQPITQVVGGGIQPKQAGSSAGTGAGAGTTPSEGTGVSYSGATRGATNSSNVSGIAPPRRLQKKHSKPRTLLAAAGAYRRGLGKKMSRRIDKARPIRSLARGVAGLYGATALGMAGAILGAASGDPTKAFQYATAGAAGGYNMGKGIGGRTVDALTVDSKSIQDEVDMTWYGDEYKKKKIEEEKLKLKRNEEYIDYLRKTMGVSRKGAKEILEKTGDSCIDAGITKIEDIAAVDQMSRQTTYRETQELEREMEEERKQKIADSGKPMTEWELQLQKERFEKRQREIEQRATEKSIAMKKFSDRTPDFTKLGQNKIDAYEKRFTREMHEEIKKQLVGQGVSAEDAETLATQRAPDAAREIIRGISEFDETKAKITKA